MFLMIRSRLCIFDKNSTEMMLCPFQCIVQGYMMLIYLTTQHLLILMVLIVEEMALTFYLQ